MGGNAFARASAAGQLALRTPRMSPATYHSLKGLYLQRLQAYFPTQLVASLVEAREKSSYGDLDFIVARDDPVDSLHLAVQLGAIALLPHHVRLFTFAVPADSSASANPMVLYTHTLSPSPTVTKEAYVAVDVEIIPTKLFDWHLFYASYGDLARILGTLLWSLGSTVTSCGLWLPLPELDAAKEPPYPVNVPDLNGLLFLSHDPQSVMHFLGLDTAIFATGFRTRDALYAWLGTGRFLDADTVGGRRANARDRTLDQSRPVFSGFFGEWVPKHLRAVSLAISVASESDADYATEVSALDEERLARKRAALVGEAVDNFHVRAEYEDKRTELLQYVHSEVAAQMLKPIVAEASGKGVKGVHEIVRAMKRRGGVRKTSRSGSVGTATEELRREPVLELYVRATSAGQESELGWLVVTLQVSAGRSSRDGDEEGGREVEGREERVIGDNGRDARAEESQQVPAGKWRFRDEEQARKWVEEHWEEMRRLERERAKAR